MGRGTDEVSDEAADAAAGLTRCEGGVCSSDPDVGPTVMTESGRCACGWSTSVCS